MNLWHTLTRYLSAEDPAERRSLTEPVSPTGQLTGHPLIQMMFGGDR